MSKLAEMNTVLFLVVILMITSVGITLNKALNQIGAENKCIAEHIQLGIERSDIIAKNGECYIKDTAL